ncbi:hypothetical protein HY639_00010 [Candidatus Woesearchaeota archaeon]|nr:hypothetical protein [Candidatus Woesearchaeota archaeon]
MSIVLAKIPLAISFLPVREISHCSVHIIDGHRDLFNGAPARKSLLTAFGWVLLGIMDKELIMPRQAIPFGHWGIITEEAFAGLVKESGFEHAVRKIFQKRWDPIMTNHIKLVQDIYLPDKFSGDYTLISALRDQRPTEHNGIVEVVKHVSPRDSQHEPPKVFPEIVAGKRHAILISDEHQSVHSPFSDEPRLEVMTSDKAVTLINRYPSYGRVIDEAVLRQARPLIENEMTKISKGINLVTIPTDYYERIEQMPPELLSAMFSSQAIAMQHVERHANRLGIRYIPFDLFFNVGQKVGGSLKWLHSQTFIDLNQDGHGRTMEEILRAFEFQKGHGGCCFCTMKKKDMADFFLYENDSLILYVNPAPQTNFETIFAFKQHIPDMLTLHQKEFMDLADVLVRDFTALNGVSAVDPDRNILVYQRPLGYSSAFHVFGKVVPYEIKGGKERIDNSRVAQYHPKSITEYLRKTGAFG